MAVCISESTSRILRLLQRTSGDSEISPFSTAEFAEAPSLMIVSVLLIRMGEELLARHTNGSIDSRVCVPLLQAFTYGNAFPELDLVH